MALTEQLPVYRDIYKLIQILFDVTQTFPRDHKYLLGQDMKHDALRLVRSIYRANRSSTEYNITRAYDVNFSCGDVSDYSKDGSHCVRAVRALLDRY